jgi:hypothetical protein
MEDIEMTLAQLEALDPKAAAAARRAHARSARGKSTRWYLRLTPGQKAKLFADARAAGYKDAASYGIWKLGLEE